MSTGSSSQSPVMQIHDPRPKSSEFKASRKLFMYSGRSRMTRRTRLTCAWGDRVMRLVEGCDQSSFLKFSLEFSFKFKSSDLHPHDG